MRVTPIRIVLICVGAICALGVVAAAVFFVLVIAVGDRESPEPLPPTSVEARVDPSLDTNAAVHLSHRWVKGEVNAQFSARGEPEWHVFDVDRKTSESSSERLEIWIAPERNAFRAQARAWWEEDSGDPPWVNARDIPGIVRMDADHMPEGDDERALTYSLDATRQRKPIHFDGKLAFRASDLTPSPYR